MPKNQAFKSTPSNAGLLALNAALENWPQGEPGVGLAGTTPPPPGFIAVTDGIALEFAPELKPKDIAGLKKKIRQKLGPKWTLRDDSVGSDNPAAPVRFQGVTALPPPGAVPSLGRAWDLARELAQMDGVQAATPLFAQLAPTPDTSAALALGLGGSAAGPGDPEIRRNWHLHQLNLPAAWQFMADLGLQPGQGVLVAVVDTGYTDHPEIFERLTKVAGNPDQVRGVDLLDGEDPRDPLEGRPFWATPSHGTAVVSVIASPQGLAAGQPGGSDFVNGIAPAAQVMPIRMTTSVILLLPNKLVPALNAAVREGAEVINISLGLPNNWPALHAAVRNAVENGVIIVAASGNYWPFVVYPAALPEVLAAAACDIDRQPWNWASAGEAVDVLAPGVAVQRAYAQRPNGSGQITYLSEPGTGTTFAAACCTGLAALWLSRHGGRGKLIDHYGGEARRIPQAFHYLIRQTALPFPETLPQNRYGAGWPQADALLQAELPTPQELDTYVETMQLQLVETIAGEISPFYGFSLPQVESAPDQTALGLRSLLGLEPAGPLFASLLKELHFHIASRPELQAPLRDLLVKGQVEPLREQLLAHEAYLSTALKARLKAASTAAPGAPPAPPPVPGSTPVTSPAIRPPRPPAPAHRPLHVYAFDPSLGATLETAAYNQTTINVRWEELIPGPVGDYLELVDVDPATGCVYAPVNLDDPYLLASDGLEPAEGSPQFHQQMVYAVAMKTIAHFEKALGRPAFWASAPYQDSQKQWHPEPFVQRLRVYPHALRARNAYYSPDKCALLFGYFRSPGPDDQPTGPTVFTCLSYDIIAHETTHALLDGMYRRYVNSLSPDALAFHEAFSDIVALFQHFTHSDVLRAAIEATRGDLEADSLLGKLAKQFGEATGKRGALRDAIGWADAEGIWRRLKPNPNLLRQKAYRVSAHQRGSILVAAVFDAFLKLYKQRTKPIIQLATGGSGELPSGNISADLATALADEAAKTAGHVLNICIRALDYLPPVDLTFGEYLRAIITADRDLVPEDPLGYRVAFAEAFRAWGITPEGITTVTPESLRWYEPEVEPLASFMLRVDMRDKLNRLLTDWRVTRDRAALHAATVWAKRKFNGLLRQEENRALGPEIGIDLSRSFEVHTLRPASSIGPDGETNPLVVVTLTQQKREGDRKHRTGSTILFNLGDGRIRYVIHKRDRSGRRAGLLEEEAAFRAAAAQESDPYAIYTRFGEPFAALHLTGRL